MSSTTAEFRAVDCCGYLLEIIRVAYTGDYDKDHDAAYDLAVEILGKQEECSQCFDSSWILHEPDNVRYLDIE